MRKVLIILSVIYLLSLNVSASEFLAPSAPPNAEKYMPIEQSTFGEDVWYIIRQILPDVLPAIHSALSVCATIIAICIITSMLKSMSGLSARAIELSGAVAAGTALLTSSKNFIFLAVDTVESVCEYGKLLFPVMSAALAAEGGVTASASLYSGTVVFNTVLSSGIIKLIVPILYAYLSVGIVLSTYSISILQSFKAFFKWLMTWTLKIGIYLFTGYLGITKVISGTTDAAALKATKMTISGLVPVVGGMISDASETILLSVGIMKNTAGIYGALTVISICLLPFLTIGVQSALLKLTEGVCALFGMKSITGITHDFSFCMEFLLAVTGAVCILLLISIVCFMKGVT